MNPFAAFLAFIATSPDHHFARAANEILARGRAPRAALPARTLPVEVIDCPPTLREQQLAIGARRARRRALRIAAGRFTRR